MTPQAEQDLREALALLEKATPGRYAGHMRRDRSMYVSVGDAVKGPHAQGDVLLPYDDVAAMVAAVNLLRTHGDALLALAARREDAITDAMVARAADAYEAAAASDGFDRIEGDDKRAIHLRWIRAALAAATPPSHPAREGREGVQGRKTLVPLPANAEFIGWAVRHESGRFDLDGVSDFGEPTHAEREALNDDTPSAEWVLIYSVREDAASPTPPTGTRTAE